MEITLDTLAAFARMCDHHGTPTACDGNCCGCRRREFLVDYALVGRSYAQLAAAHGVSRERAKQIVKSAGAQLLAQGWRPDVHMSYPLRDAA